MIFKILLASSLFLGTTLAADWGYSGTKGATNWYKDYPTCEGERQSPINIYEGDIKKSDTLGQLTFINYNTVSGISMVMKNTGHTVEITYDGSTTQLLLSGNGLGAPGEQFRAYGFHFHWGSDLQSGSEHLINMKKYPCEMHIVHYNAKYVSISEAVNKTDGLAVIGVMIEVSPSDNAAFTSITSNLNRIQQKDQSVSISPFPLQNLLPRTTNLEYFRYPGSLTTPGCFQSVTWTVLKQPVKMSQNQLDQFRGLLDTDQQNMQDNYRPIQSINSREVQSNFDTDTHWGYEIENKYVTPPNWQNYYEACGGTSQSPIDIPKFGTEIDAENNFNLGTITFTNYNTISGQTLKIKNNGHTAEVVFENPIATISGGGLPDTYVLAQLHFHWGNTMQRGSEHLLYGSAFPMEMHIVHYKQSLGGLGPALGTNDTEALAVLGFFFEESSSDNPNYTPITNALPSVQQPTNTELPFATITVDSLLPAKRDHFFRYPGSLTTPTCNQQVLWTVFGDTIPISATQMTAFRNILSAEKDDQGAYLKLVNNFRPVQATNERIVKVHVPKWGYEGDVGPAKWGKYHPYCEDTPSSRQSPINLDPMTINFDVALKDFTFTSGYGEDVQMTMKNNGHTVECTFDSSKMTMTNGGLTGSFRPAQFHFHWGSDNSQGSEHTIADKKFPMEMHVVHYNTKYAWPTPAIKEADGLAVLGFMFEVGDKDTPNTAFSQIVANLANVKDADDTVTIPNVNLKSLMGDKLGDYYRYDGSLTTPGCFQSVKWTVFREPIRISEAQMIAFRGLMSSEKKPDGSKYPLVNNYRPVMNSNKRQVSANFFIGSGMSATYSGLALILCACAALSSRLS